MPYKAELTHREVFHCFQNLGLVFPTERTGKPQTKQTEDTSIFPDPSKNKTKQKYWNFPEDGNLVFFPSCNPTAAWQLGHFFGLFLRHYWSCLAQAVLALGLTRVISSKPLLS